MPNTSTPAAAEADGPLTRNRSDGDSFVLAELKLMNTKIDGMKTSIERKINTKVDGLKDALTTLVNDSVNSLKAELKAELALKTKEIQGNLDREIGHVVARIEQVEQKLNRDEERAISRFDPEVSIIVSGLVYEEEEDVEQVISELLSEGPGGWMENWPVVVAAERMKERGDRPGVIKVEFATVQQKVDVLRKKKELKNNESYKEVYIRSAKTHTERLIELNFRTLLNELPSGKKFFVTGNGRVRRKPTDAPGEDAFHTQDAQRGPAVGGRGALHRANRSGQR